MDSIRGLREVADTVGELLSESRETRVAGPRRGALAQPAVYTPRIGGRGGRQVLEVGLGPAPAAAAAQAADAHALRERPFDAGAAMQEATDQSVQVAYVEKGYTGAEVAQDAHDHGIALEVVKLPQGRQGFVLLARRWVVERSFAWAARFRRLARDFERLPATLAGLHYLAFVCLMLRQLAGLLQSA